MVLLTILHFSSLENDMMTLQKMSDNGDAHFPQCQVDDSHTANNRTYIKITIFNHKEEQIYLFVLVGLKLL